MASSAEPRYAIGVDLGGTKIEAALVDTEGRITDTQRTPTDAKRGPDHVVEAIV